MFRRIFAAGLCLSLLLTTACADAEAQTTPQPEVEKEPPLTLEEVQAVTFPDLPGETAYHDSAAYLTLKGAMGGKNEEFRPDELATQSLALRVLADLEKTPVPAGEELTWAEELGFLRDAEGFQPEGTVTRQWLAQLLHDYAGSKGVVQVRTKALPDYWDGQPSPELGWALENNFFPDAVRSVEPDFLVSRAQLAQAVTAAMALITGEELPAQMAAQEQAVHTKLYAPAAHEKIQAAIDAAAAKYGAIGVQVAVVEHGTVSDKFGGGWATRYGKAPYSQAAGPDAQTLGDPMTADHKLRIASLSKVAIGMTAMAMQERGIIDLDTSIGEYWGGLPARNPQHPDYPVTMRTIMTHTSSLAMLESTEAKGEAVRNRLANNRGFSGAVPGDIGYWGYNNYAFGVLGITMERAGNRIMDQLSGEYLFEPVGADAAFESGNVKNTDMLAAIYRAGEPTRTVEMQKGMTKVGPPGSNGVYFAGGLTTSAADMAKLVAVLANDGSYEGRRVLTAESVAAMETSHGTVGGDAPFEQCLVIRRQDNIYGRDSLHYHTGSAYGVYNLLSYDPATGDGVVVLSSGARGAKDSRGIYSIGAEISQAVYAAIDELRAAEAPAETEDPAGQEPAPQNEADTLPAEEKEELA